MSCLGLYHGEDLWIFGEYVTTSITVLAVAVPEGLPLAVTLALVWSSNQARPNPSTETTSFMTLARAETISLDMTQSHELCYQLMKSKNML